MRKNQPDRMIRFWENHLPPRIFILRSNPIAPDPRVEKVARALAAFGYAVHAVGWDRTSKLVAEETRDGYAITRLPIAAGYGKGLGNLPQLVRWQFHLWRWLIRHRQEFDVIHACDFDTVLPALFCKWWYRKMVVYDIFDFYADHLRSTPEAIKRLIRKTDYWAINHSDAVIIVDESRREQIQGSRPRQLTVIYNTPEEQELPPIAKPVGFTITYVGLLQVERGLLELIEVVARHPDWVLELAGFGGDAALIQQRAAGLPNVHWHGRIDYRDALYLSQKATVLIATYNPAIPNHRYSSPNKVFEAMMLGKSVIVAKDTNMDKIIEEEQCGVVVAYGSVPDLEAALMRLANYPAQVETLGKHGRQAYDQKYNWAIMSERLLGVYRDVLGDIREAG